jgi:xylulokinase
VVVLPYLDGERTPNLPASSGLVTGLRHTTTPRQILMAAYEGAVASLLVAFDAIGEAVGGLDPDAPLLLVGGGARGETWRSVVRRLTGRAVQIPVVTEAVAMGAAAQAAAVLHGERPTDVASRWGVGRGRLLDPLPVDQERLARIRAVLAAELETPQRTRPA